MPKLGLDLDGACFECRDFLTARAARGDEGGRKPAKRVGDCGGEEHAGRVYSVDESSFSEVKKGFSS